MTVPTLSSQEVQAMLHKIEMMIAEYNLEHATFLAQIAEEYKK